MKKNEIPFTVMSLAPAFACILLLFFYPIMRIFVMSFFQLRIVSERFANWKFYGLENYRFLFSNYLFRRSVVNMLKIWIIGGMGTFLFALIFAFILSSGVKAKGFWRAAIFFPNTISAVALANMWLQYVYNSNFGLLKTIFTALGMENLAAIQWTGPDYIFGSMLFSYCFACTGYYMLIFLAGIEKIPGDLYENAYLEGAGKLRCFFIITLPLIRNVFRTSIMLWTIGTVNFFTWSMLYSQGPALGTVVPGVYMYASIFGNNQGGGKLDIGAGAGIGTIMTLIVIIAYAVMDKFFPEEEVEY